MAVWIKKICKDGIKPNWVSEDKKIYEYELYKKCCQTCSQQDHKINTNHI